MENHGYHLRPIDVEIEQIYSEAVTPFAAVYLLYTLDPRPLQATARTLCATMDEGTKRGATQPAQSRVPEIAFFLSWQPATRRKFFPHASPANTQWRPTTPAPLTGQPTRLGKLFPSRAGRPCLICRSWRASMCAILMDQLRLATSSETSEK